MRELRHLPLIVDAAGALSPVPSKASFLVSSCRQVVGCSPAFAMRAIDAKQP
jgi:hypothetical protein